MNIYIHSYDNPDNPDNHDNPDNPDNHISIYIYIYSDMKNQQKRAQALASGSNNPNNRSSPGMTRQDSLQRVWSDSERKLAGNPS